MRAVFTIYVASTLFHCAYHPSQAVQDARLAYSKAEKSRAAALAPVELRQAQLAVAAAERADREDGGSYQAQDLAYIAIRRAQIAEQRGDIEQARRVRDNAEKELSAATGRQLEDTRKQLAKIREENAQISQRADAQAQKAEEAQRQAEEAKRLTALAEKKADEALAEVARLEKVSKDQRGQVITLPSGLLFKSGKAILNVAARPRLDEVAVALKKLPDRKLVIEGHTDATGSEDVNIDLSERRAKAVKDYLVSKGVPEDRVTTLGAGPSRPIADNGSREGRAMNRRVEIVIVAPDEDTAVNR